MRHTPIVIRVNMPGLQPMTKSNPGTIVWIVCVEIYVTGS